MFVLIVLKNTNKYIFMISQIVSEKQANVMLGHSPYWILF